MEVVLDGHDFAFHLERLEGIYRAMASGDFPVRMNAWQVEGYGYLSSTMYPPLFLYIFSAYRLICMYVGVSLGEALALTFLPLVIWGAYECLWGEPFRRCRLR